MGVGTVQSSAVGALDRAFHGTQHSAPPPRSRHADDYHVEVPVFEGPLDLLLHLIRKDQINIYDIPIALICETYLQHVRAMQELDINTAGEFMVMASTLIYLKSVVLLPQEVSPEEEDPRLPLVQQLLEYERLKIAAGKLEARPWLFRDLYPRPAGIAVDFLPPESALDAPVDRVDPMQVLICLHQSLQRTTRPALEITSDKTSIREKVVSVAQQLEIQNVVQYSELVGPAPSVQEIIVCFLALLELARLKFIEIVQHENFGPIQVRGVRSLAELDAGLLEQY